MITVLIRMDGPNRPLVITDPAELVDVLAMGESEGWTVTLIGG